MFFYDLKFNRLFPFLWVVACLFLCGCDSGSSDSSVTRKGVRSADLIGSWSVEYVSGTEHPMVGGVMELTEEGEVLSYLASGEREEGKSPSFWSLFQMDSGEAVIVLDLDASSSKGGSSIVEKLEMPMAVVIEGDKMTWSLLMRDEMKRVSPSDKAVYKFTRK